MDGYMNLMSEVQIEKLIDSINAKVDKKFLNSMFKEVVEDIESKKSIDKIDLDIDRVVNVTDIDNLINYISRIVARKIRDNLSIQNTTDQEFHKNLVRVKNVLNMEGVDYKSGVLRFFSNGNVGIGTTSPKDYTSL